MTTNQGRGGYRKPANPAPVSLPQSGRRTDGGAGDKQPIRTPTGGTYGSAKALTEQQQSAPLPAGGPGPQGMASGGQGGGGVPPAQAGGFGPTQRPNEPITAGTAAGFGEDELQSRAILQKIYESYRSPYIRGLLGDAY